MFAARLLLRPNKAATGWAVLARRNGTVPALPSCSPFPYCAALARRNGAAPALPSVSPSPYCISFFIGPRHMSSSGRRDFLLDRIALQLEAEGIPYTASLDKIINKFLNEALEDMDQKEHDLSLLKRENEKLIEDIEKMHSEFRCEIDKVTARSLDLNLERGRIHDEIAKEYAEITDLIAKLDREIHALQAQWELKNTRS